MNCAFENNYRYRYITALTTDGFNLLKFLAPMNGFSKRCNIPPARIRKTGKKTLLSFVLKNSLTNKYNREFVSVINTTKVQRV